MKFKLQAAAIGFTYASLGLVPAYADDTDIFLGKVTAGTVKPNVLFILDNSGSMADPVGNGDTRSRLQAMKNSVKSILNNVEGVNAGIMSFNDPGGSIRYPVTDLDQLLVGREKLFIQTGQNSDDAMQSLSSGGGNGNVTLTGSRLTFGTTTDPSNLTTLTRNLGNDNDDAEETLSSGSISINGNSLDMQNGQENIFRFQNVTIPTGTTITNASLRFTARGNNGNDVTLRFYGDNSANSAAVTTTNRNISNRVKSINFVDWQPSSWDDNASYNTADLSPIIQEIVNIPTWANGNSLSIIQTHETNGGLRQASSYRDNASDAPRLNVTYRAAGAPYIHQRIGLRFDDVLIPRGATITNAYIELTPSATNSPDAGLPLVIRLEDSADAGAFTSANGDLTAASTYASTVNWLTEDWVSGQVVQTPDVTALLQQIANRSDWCGGNAVAFYIQPDVATTLSRSAYSYDEGSSKQPRLVVEYDPASVPVNTCNQVIIRKQISGRPNDAEETNSNGDVDNNGNILNMNSSQTNGLRFENLPLVQGANIIEANLIFTANGNQNSSSTMTLRTQNSVDPNNFPESRDNITDRTRLPGSVIWNNSSTPALSNWTSGVKYRSPDVRSIIQPLVNNASWNPNDNGVVFIQTLTGAERTAHTYDGSAADSVVLEIKVNSTHLQGGASQLTVRSHLINIVDGLGADTYTPIVDTLYEAARYYRGDSVYWGQSRQSPYPYPGGSNYGTNTATKLKRVSDMASIVSGTGSRVMPPGCTDANLGSSNCEGEYISGQPVYKSPIVEACQANYIVLLTDGLANQNHSASKIRSYVGHSGSCENSNGNEACSEELVEWMANTDMSGVDGENNINTFTIAFALNNAGAIDYLEGISSKGGGRHYNAGSEGELTNAFNNIISSILSRDATFVVPGTTVSQFNRMSHYEDIFFSVFKPSKTPRWEGNLKKYKISRTDTNYGRIVGQGDTPAVDPDTGFFEDGVTSFWSNLGNPDGADVSKGGAALQLPANPDSRKVYTYYSGASNTLLANPLDESNTNITKDMLGISSASDIYRQNLLNWARGEDVFDNDGDGSTNDARLQYGDPLHSAPVAITYGGTLDAPDFTVFFGTNDGYLHAVDGATGEELFAFIPELLLPNLKILYDNAVTDKHPYGVDGNITRWVNDANKDGIINAADGDHVYIYFGLRRGGNYYYALDVTDRSNPKLMWQIDGSTSPYEELGQSWSQPQKARVKVMQSGSPVEKEVLIFAGGYDEDQDTNSVRTADDEGRAVFMVEAGYPGSGDTPDLLWSAGNSVSHDLNLADMRYSIPGAVTVGDTTGDGFVNIMFAADTGGQIWRFDVNNGQDIDNLVAGAVIADLAGNDAANARRFYDGVDAATVAYKGTRFITLTVGSGWRANPLNDDVEDRFYMIKQPLTTPNTYTKLTEVDLYDATANLAGSTNVATATQAKIDLNSSTGWYIRLTNLGEKVLSAPVTASLQTLFTTYQPEAQTNPCNPNPGVGRLYGVNLFDATPILRDVNDNLTRSIELESGNIPSTPTLVVLPDGTIVTLVGPEEEGELLDSSPINKTYWYEKDDPRDRGAPPGEEPEPVPAP